MPNLVRCGSHYPTHLCVEVDPNVFGGPKPIDPGATYDVVINGAAIEVTFRVGGARALCQFIAAFGSTPGSKVAFKGIAVNVDAEAPQLHWVQGRAVNVAAGQNYTLVFT